jgi:hypothetical protein
MVSDKFPESRLTPCVFMHIVGYRAPSLGITRPSRSRPRPLRLAQWQGMLSRKFSPNLLPAGKDFAIPTAHFLPVGNGSAKLADRGDPSSGWPATPGTMAARPFEQVDWFACGHAGPSRRVSIEKGRWRCGFITICGAERWGSVDRPFRPRVGQGSIFPGRYPGLW